MPDDTRASSVRSVGSDQLDIAVVVDSTPVVPAWVLRVLNGLDHRSGLDWTTTLRLAQRPRRRPSLGLRLLEVADAWRHARDVDDALADRDAGSLFAEREVVDIDEGEPVPLDLSVRATHPLAAVIDLRDEGDAAELAGYAHCDVWRAEPAWNGHVGSEAVFWAIHDRRSVCEVRIVVHGHQEGAARAVASATVGIQPASLMLSTSTCYWKASKLILDRLSWLSRDDRPADTACDHGPASSARPVEPSRRPDTAAVARVVGRQALVGARNRLDSRGTREQWILGYRKRETEDVRLDVTGFRPVFPPEDRTYADPFLVDVESSMPLLFFEEYEFARGRGVISVAALQHDGAPLAPEVVLERPYHLSYPFVFSDGDDYYMIPETASNRTVELYRAREFPRGWSLDQVLLDGVRALDSTLVVVDDTYWLFTCIEDPGRSRHDELHLFSSPTLRGPWTPHSRNPVVSDVRNARPAGRPFFVGDSLIRPAQDCSGRYGSSIVLRRVLELSDEAFAEESVGVLSATWAPNLLATHTLATSREVDLIDGLRRIPRQ